MLLVNIFLIFFWLFIFLNVIYTDIRYRIISNRIVIFTLINVFLSAIFLDFKLYFFNAFIIFLICFILFYFGLIGGGDAKFLAVLALILPTNKILLFFLIMSIVGFFIAIFCVISKSKSVPYGVAIVLGFCIVMYQRLIEVIL